MWWNNRKAARVHFEHKHLVNIMGVDGTWRRSCALLDISDTGAKLEVEGSTDALKAQEFFLVLSSTGLAFRRCELVWINGAHVGVHFVTGKTRKKGASKDDHLARAR
ncbi:PilZ domain-containing protein [Bradyrhizobium sp. PMVTL-01]|uniref:PilZ domain-containing protein n=1 Tax=unclassified Bradyrhizobium TaxID=2631580 RepID=UPI003F71218F